MALSEGVLAAVFGEDALAEGADSLARRGRWILVILGALLSLMGWVFSGLGRRAALVTLSTLLPIAGYEAFAGPFVGRDTTIFQHDPELGWKLRAGARDRWLGADVVINSRGMRGPEPRQGAAQTILFLGDSVVFGAFIERDDETLSARAEAALVSAGFDVQCLNAGVGGWSPWQERAWYETEGAHFGAGIVLIHTVLNDVTEPLVLERHGGDELGFQLDRARDPGWWRGTTWATSLRHLRRKAHAEDEQRMAARAAALGVYELLRAPALPGSRRAWEMHLREVGALVDSVRAAGAVPVVISHPYTVQFEAPGLWWPQDSTAEWCETRGVLHFDAGRVLLAGRPDPAGAYHDADHPNREGAALLGEEIASFLLSEGLVH